MYVAIINTPGNLPDTAEELPTYDTVRDAWAYLASELRAEVDDDRAIDSSEKEPDALVAMEIISSPTVWTLTNDTSVAKSVATYFGNLGLGPDGTGWLEARGRVWEVRQG